MFSSRVNMLQPDEPHLSLAPTFVVAPCTGAWIETVSHAAGPLALGVAPCTGAWIETYQRHVGITAAKSPLVRGRGLKLFREPGPAIGRPSYGGVD